MDKIISRLIPDHLQIISQSFVDHPKIIFRSSPIISKWSADHPLIVFRSSSVYFYILRSSQNHLQNIFRSSSDHLHIIFMDHLQIIFRSSPDHFYIMICKSHPDLHILFWFYSDNFKIIYRFSSDHLKMISTSSSDHLPQWGLGPHPSFSELWFNALMGEFRSRLV